MSFLKRLYKFWSSLNDFWQILALMSGGTLTMAVLAIFQQMSWPWVLIFAVIGGVIGYAISTLMFVWEGESGRREKQKSPIKIVELKKVPNTPSKNYTAIRIEFRNDSGEAITGLLAKLADIHPEALSIAKPGEQEKDIVLPVNLATKARLDLHRSNGQPLPNQRFNLGPFETKEVEVFWLYSPGSLEVNITHEAGENDFVFMEGEYRFSVEISGIGRPARTIVRLWKTDIETSAWECELLENPHEKG
jgi:hypothetical protein